MFYLAVSWQIMQPKAECNFRAIGNKYIVCMSNEVVVDQDSMVSEVYNNNAKRWAFVCGTMTMK
jgi:hypothetical protein